MDFGVAGIVGDGRARSGDDQPQRRQDAVYEVLLFSMLIAGNLRHRPCPVSLWRGAHAI